MNELNHSSNKQLLSVVINGEAVIEYDRGSRLPRQQQTYLDRMDRQMDQGVNIGEDIIKEPDQLQRAQFVAMHLVEAIQQENDAITVASCAWLASRIPDLKQVRAEINNSKFLVDLVFDRAYSKEIRVDLSMPAPGKSH